MKGKIALITGANKGIGFETARQLGQLGYQVILAARQLSAAHEAVLHLQQKGIEARAVQLDVTDEQSIAAAVDTVSNWTDHLDGLVNNAGIMRDRFDVAPSQQSLETWRSTFDTNVFGVVAVTNAFLPMLHRAVSARIVNVSSILGSMAANVDPSSAFYNFKIPAYNISKSALNAWTIHLGYELRDTSIKVNAAHPGFVKTDLHGVDAPMSPAEGAQTSVRLVTLPDDGPNGAFFHGHEVQPW